MLSPRVFNEEERERVSDYLLQLAHGDPRVVAAAVVGSGALGRGDRWSDIDLSFSVADDHPIVDVLRDFSQQIVREFDALHLFDLPSGPSIYRVFLIPGCLQCDISFTPAGEFRARGPKFQLLFGTSLEKQYFVPPSQKELLGYAVHHALRARFSIERSRFWQAEYWIGGVRQYALALACYRLNLPTREARGFDDLPQDVKEAFAGALVTSLNREALLRALTQAIEGLQREVGYVDEVAAKLEPQLRSLTIPWT